MDDLRRSMRRPPSGPDTHRLEIAAPLSYARTTWYVTPPAAGSRVARHQSGTFSLTPGVSVMRLMFAPSRSITYSSKSPSRFDTNT